MLQGNYFGDPTFNGTYRIIGTHFGFPLYRNEFTRLLYVSADDGVYTLAPTIDDDRDDGLYQNGEAQFDPIGQYAITGGGTAPAGVIGHGGPEASSESSSSQTDSSISSASSVSSPSSGSSHSTPSSNSSSSSSSTAVSLTSSSHSSASSNSSSSSSSSLINQATAIDLNNGTSGLVVTSAATTAFTVRPMTVECWIKVSNNSANNRVLYNNDWQIDIDDNRNGSITVTLLGSGANIATSDLFPSGVILNNTWQHLAMVLDSGSALSLYVDGVLVAGGTGKTLNSATNSVLKFGDGFGTDVQLDEIRISNVARYTSGFDKNTAKCWSADGNTVAYWHCDEGSGTTVADVTGNHPANWTISGTAHGSLVTSWTAGVSCVPDNSSSSSIARSTSSSSSSTPSSHSTPSSQSSSSSSTAVSLTSSSNSSSSSERDFLVTKNSSLFHYYAFEELSAPWVDSVSANNLTVAFGADEISATGGKHGNALLLDFASEGITAQVHNTFCTNTPTSGGFAFSAWVTGGTGEGIIAFGGSMQFVYSGGNSASLTTTQTNTTPVTASGTLAGLVHVVCIAADGKVEIYGNGSLMDSQTFNNTFSAMANVIVTNNGGSQFLVDELAYWKNISFGSSALRHEFALGLWNNGNGRFYNGTTFI